MVRALLLIAVAGCGRIGFDPLGDDAGPLQDGRPVDTAPTNCTPVAGCPGDTISLDNTSSIGDSNPVTADNGIGASCGGNANPQASWQLNPLTAGTYTVTVTSGGLSVIHIKDMCCTGPEIICVGPGQPAVIQRQQGQTAFIFVETAPGNATIQVQGS